MKIYGAGMAGLICANMLRRHSPVIYEAQPSLPNNHEALLRFRTDAVSRVTGIPFKPVSVDKIIFYRGRYLSSPSINLNNHYSYKVTGEYGQRSITSLKSVDRYIAPPNFIEQMARSCTIRYSAPLVGIDLEDGPDPVPFISTVPMPVLMDIVQWPKPNFTYRSIWALTFDCDNVELYQTIYFPGEEPYYRASISGTRVIIEYMDLDETQKEQPTIRNQTDSLEVLKAFGIHRPKIRTEPRVTFQKYGKLAPMDEAERRRFITNASDNYSIYSLGRFATWRQILLDDIVQDVQRIEKWIVQPGAYARRLEEQK